MYAHNFLPHLNLHHSFFVFYKLNKVSNHISFSKNVFNVLIGVVVAFGMRFYGLWLTGKSGRKGPGSGEGVTYIDVEGHVVDE